MYYFLALLIKYLGVIASFLFTVQIANYLDVKLVGEISGFIAFAAIFQIAFLFGRQNLILREYPRLENSYSKFSFITMLQRKINTTALPICIIAIFLIFFSNSYFYFFLAAPFGFFLAKNLAASAVLKASSMGGTAAFYESFLRWLIILVSIQMLFIFKYEYFYESVFLIMMASTLLCYFIANLTIFKKLRIQNKQKLLTKIPKGDNNIGLAALALSVNENLPVILSFIVFSEEIAANTRVAYSLGMLLALSSATINQLIAKNISKSTNMGNHSNKKNDLFALLANLILLVSILFFGILFLDEIIPYVFGVEYIDAYLMAIIFMLAQVISALFGPTAQHLDMIKRSDYLYKSVLVSIFFQIISILVVYALKLSFIFIPLSYLASIIIWNLFAYVLLRQKTNYLAPISELFRRN